MAALTQGRNTPQWQGDVAQGPAAAGVTIYEGGIVMRNAAGNLVAGQAGVGLVAVGRAENRVLNFSGDAGDVQVRFRPGIFHYGNSGGADAITQGTIGKPCYVVDDQTVAATNGANTRSPAGFVHAVDDQGVWVRFDEAMTRLA